MIIGHIATWLGLRLACGDRTPLETMITEPSEWQTGWDYQLHLRRVSQTK